MSFYREKLVLTKKPHRCFGCWRKFPEKTKLWYVTGMGEEGFCANYECPTCHEIFKTMDRDECAETSPGDLYDLASKKENEHVTSVPAGLPQVPCADEGTRV